MWRVLTGGGVWLGRIELLTITCLLGGWVYAAGSESPTEVVKTTIEEVIRLLEDEQLKQPGRLDQRRKLIEEAIGNRFDYEELSKRALAAQWNKLDDDKRKEFVELFKELLSDAYADRIEGYSGEQVHYLKERIEGSYAEVQTKIVSSKVDLPADYRLFNKAGKWRVYDVVVDGVSLVKNYRAQFERTLKTSSYPELVNKLRNKSEELKTHRPKS